MQEFGASANYRKQWRAMLKKRRFMKSIKPGQIVAFSVLLGLLVFFLKDAGISDIFAVIAVAVIMAVIFLPWSEAANFDDEDIIDWKLVTHLSEKDD
jgi:hypothetical protein